MGAGLRREDSQDRSAASLFLDRHGQSFAHAPAVRPEQFRRAAAGLHSDPRQNDERPPADRRKDHSLQSESLAGHKTRAKGEAASAVRGYLSRRRDGTRPLPEAALRM